MRERTKLLNQVDRNVKEMAYYRAGIFPTSREAGHLKRRWIGLFGFEGTIQMTNEDLGNFILLLQAKIRVLKRNNCFPEFHNFLGVGTKAEGESIYD